MKRFLLALVATGLVASGAAGQGRLELRLAPGPTYRGVKWFGPARITLLPQIAIWIEDSSGRFVDTIYVTKKSAKADWWFAKGARRPEALPVWSHARGTQAADGSFMPEADHPLPDAVSGATPGATFALAWELPPGLALGTYRIRAELNLSYDWNEAYPDKLPKSDPRRTRWNGQPSIVWEAALPLGATESSAELMPVGSGSLDGSEGSIRPGLEGLTSSRTIAASIIATYKP